VRFYDVSEYDPEQEESIIVKNRTKYKNKPTSEQLNIANQKYKFPTQKLQVK